MKLSIIVPVYNAEKYLDKCLKSLVEQTFDDFEIICVNDGSTDRSLFILNEYAREFPDIIKVISTTNGGQGRARNLGIEVSEGDFIGFVDSDDWVDITMFEKLYSAVIKENADISICRVMDCYDDYSSVSTESSDARIEDTASCIYNKIYRRSVIDGLKFPEGLWYEDLGFGIQVVSSTNKYAFVEEPLYYYRIGHTSTMTNQNAQKNLDIISIMDIIYHYFKDNDKDMNTFEYLLINHVLIDAIRRVSLMKTENKKAVIKQLRAYAHFHIPTLNNCLEYRNTPKSRKLAIFLNYHGLEAVTVFIIKLKAKADSFLGKKCASLIR